MILCTSESIPGKKIQSCLGLVRGNTIRSRHIGKDISAFVKTLFGGEIADYTKMMAESREQALDRMIEDARSLGANGIIAVRFTTTSMLQGSSEMMVYGTAVLLEDE